MSITNILEPLELSKKLNLTTQDEPMERDEIVKHVKDILAESVMSGHKHFHNQLYSG